MGDKKIEKFFVKIGDVEYELPGPAVVKNISTLREYSTSSGDIKYFDLLGILKDNRVSEVDAILSSCLGAANMRALESDNDSMEILNTKRTGLTKIKNDICELSKKGEYNEAYVGALSYLKIVLGTYEEMVLMGDACRTK